MSFSLYPLLRAALFRMDAETAHELTLNLLGAAPRLWSSLLTPTRAPASPRSVGGVMVRGPVGLAAGLTRTGAPFRFGLRSASGSLRLVRSPWNLNLETRGPGCFDWLMSEPSSTGWVSTTTEVRR
jgi:hypothetical protein